MTLVLMRNYLVRLYRRVYNYNKRDKSDIWKFVFINIITNWTLHIILIIMFTISDKFL